MSKSCARCYQALSPSLIKAESSFPSSQTKEILQVPKPTETHISNQSRSSASKTAVKKYCCKLRTYRSSVYIPLQSTSLKTLEYHAKHCNSIASAVTAALGSSANSPKQLLAKLPYCYLPSRPATESNSSTQSLTCSYTLVNLELN